MLTLKLLAVNKSPLGPYEDVEFLIAPSGSYAAGGDTCDLTTLYGQADPQGRMIGSSLLPIFANVQGMAGIAAGGNNPNNYELRTYLNPNNGNAATALTPATCLLQVYAGNTEASAAGYTNGVLSDYIVCKATFQGQQ